jgi:ribosomal protein S5
MVVEAEGDIVNIDHHRTVLVINRRFIFLVFIVVGKTRGRVSASATMRECRNTGG